MNDISSAEHEKLLMETARRVLPAGGFGNMASDIIIREGKGGHVWDVTGREYIDFLIGSGPMFVGHNHPEVTAAAREQLERGTTFFANNEHGILLAERIVSAMACADQVRYVSTGTEADAYAMRLARAYRQRDKVLKFEGGYHGMSDYALMSLAPKRLVNFPNAVPDSPGIPASVQQEMLVAPFNDIEHAVAMIREHHDELACVIVEPLQRLIPPAPGFLEALRAITAEYGIVLIFDEVVTGFRMAYGGAQEFYGVTPDLCTLGKVIGGGFPLAAIAGKAEIMAHFDKAKVAEDRFLTQVGTLSGNPVAAAAGLATLDILNQPGVYEKVFATGTALMKGLEERVAAAGIPGKVVGAPIMFDVLFTSEDVRDYRGMFRADAERQKRINKRLRDNGVLKGDGKYYISLAHTETDVAHTLDAFEKALAAE